MQGYGMQACFNTSHSLPQRCACCTGGREWHAAQPTLMVRSSEAEAKVLVSLGLNTTCAKNNGGGAGQMVPCCGGGQAARASQAEACGGQRALACGGACNRNKALLSATAEAPLLLLLLQANGLAGAK